MLTTDDLRAILAATSYRPGWRLSIHENPWEGPYLRVVATLDDAYSPGTPIDIGVTSYPSPNDLANPAAFDRWLAWRLGRIESHESREWLRRDGRALYDPHTQEG